MYIYCHVNEPPPQDLAILTDPADNKNSKTSGQNTNAGWFNRYIQTGKSDHETKSNGCIGGMPRLANAFCCS